MGEGESSVKGLCVFQKTRKVWAIHLVVFTLCEMHHWTAIQFHCTLYNNKKGIFIPHDRCLCVRNELWWEQSKILILFYPINLYSLPSLKFKLCLQVTGYILLLQSTL